jgi:hypothetical protein
MREYMEEKLISLKLIITKIPETYIVALIILIIVTYLEQT